MLPRRRRGEGYKRDKKKKTWVKLWSSLFHHKKLTAYALVYLARDKSDVLAVRFQLLAHLDIGSARNDVAILSNSVQ